MSSGGSTPSRSRHTSRPISTAPGAHPRGRLALRVDTRRAEEVAAGGEAVIWGDFKREASELAAFGEERFERAGLVLVGTLRRNGWPRISPVEPLIADGRLYLGMMWRSVKALDLLRDPRCTVQSIVSNRDASEGEFKLYGRAVEVPDLAERGRYAEALFQKIGFRPEEPEYHLFSIDIESTSSAVIRDDEWVREVWSAD